MDLKTLAVVFRGQCSGASDVVFDTICIDGRHAKAGALFFALQGEQHDGHDFIEQAAQHGAVAAVVSQPGYYPIPTVLVQDTLASLAALACHHRDRLSPKVIAVTGSCGKTTVKEMIKAILPASSFATRGNLNNHIGVPLSLLGLKPEHTHAVFELGANHIGEIAQTVAWVRPHVAMINNVGAAHLEGFGSLAGVATAKSEIFGGLDEQTGIAVVNGDDPRVVEKAASLRCRRLVYGLTDAAQIRALDVKPAGQGCYTFVLDDGKHSELVALQVPGRHHVHNALAAASCTLALGCDWESVVQGLNAFSGVDGRLTFHVLSNGVRLIDDTYNANPSSVSAAIDVLASYEGQRILVLGDLGELGDYREAYYQEIAGVVRTQGIDMFFTCGNDIERLAEYYGQDAGHYKTPELLRDRLLKSMHDDCTVLVKGSRIATMERLVQALLDADKT